MLSCLPYEASLWASPSTSCNSRSDVNNHCHRCSCFLSFAEHPWAAVLASLRLVLLKAGQKTNSCLNQNVKKFEGFMDITTEIFDLQTNYEIFSENLVVSIAVFYDNDDPGASFLCFCYGMSSQLRWYNSQDNPAPHIKNPHILTVWSFSRTLILTTKICILLWGGGISHEIL